MALALVFEPLTQGSIVAFDRAFKQSVLNCASVLACAPNFGHYDWDRPDAEQTNGYAHHAAFYARVARSHPSVVMYATSHNATGYSEDMNPDLIDGVYDRRDKPEGGDAG